MKGLARRDEPAIDIEQQDCSMLDWTSAANGALLLMPETPWRCLRTGPRGYLTWAGSRWCDDGVAYLGGPSWRATHQAGKPAQVKHEEEYATSIALERKDNQARPRPWPAPGQGRYHHCGDFEGHRLATALGTGLLRRDREEEAWTDA